MRLSINPHIRPDTWPDMRVNTRQSAPFKVDLVFIMSLHTFLVEKYVKIHKISRCYLLGSCDHILVF